MNHALDVTKISDTSDIGLRANIFYFGESNYPMAKNCFDTLLLFDSLNGAYYYRRGYSKSMLFDLTGAISDYHLSIKHNYKELHNSFLNLGVMHRALGKFDSAVYFFNKCLILDPINVKATLGKKEVLYLQSKRLQ